MSTDLDGLAEQLLESTTRQLALNAARCLAAFEAEADPAARASYAAGAQAYAFLAMWRGEDAGPGRHEPGGS